MNEFLYKEESFAVIGAAMEVHRTLGWGFLENVYQTALAHEFTLRNIPFIQQVRLPVTYKEILVGEYLADFVVYEKFIVEIKAVSNIIPSHQAQTLNYLAATGYRLALLINFDANSLQYRRVIMNTFFAKILFVAFIACILTACGVAPSPSLTLILPTAPQKLSTPRASRTPLPPPTRRISRTKVLPTLSTSVFATLATLLTQRAPAEATRHAGSGNHCTFDDETNPVSPQKDWVICGSGANFKVMHRDGMTWQFSAQDQFGVEYYGDFHMIHWTADEKFLYFAVMNPLDGAGPITSNAEALFRMDLTNGKVTIVLGTVNIEDPANQNFYVVSISPTSRRLVYSINPVYSGDVRPQTKLHLVDLQSGDEKIIPIEKEYVTIGSFVWSEDGQQLIYKLYGDSFEAFCGYLYSVRLLNLANDDSITFIKNESYNECLGTTPYEFEVRSVSADQITLEKGNKIWAYDTESQKLKLLGTVTPTP